MKKCSSVSCAVLIVTLAPLLTGCLCSGPIIDKMQETRWDTFNNPSAVYRRGCTNDFALDGTRQDKNKSYHAYLIIDPSILVRAQLQTNENLTVSNIARMYDLGIFNDQETMRKLPIDYEKVGVLPKNNMSIQIQEHYTKGAWLGFLLPVTFAVDVVTFPFQFIYLTSTGGWHT
jgi:hypothetical protein